MGFVAITVISYRLHYRQIVFKALNRRGHSNMQITHMMFDSDPMKRLEILASCKCTYTCRAQIWSLQCRALPGRATGAARSRRYGMVSLPKSCAVARESTPSYCAWWSLVPDSDTIPTYSSARHDASVIATSYTEESFYLSATIVQAICADSTVGPSKTKFELFPFLPCINDGDHISPSAWVA